MKQIYFAFFAIALLGISSLKAQTTEGTEFWLTFGKNEGAYGTSSDLYIKIVSGSEPTTGEIHFTNLGTSVPFSIPAQQVFTYELDTEKQAVYNTTTGVTNLSIHITSTESVSVYAMNQAYATTDATNIYPVATLGLEYYQISYTAVMGRNDAFAVIAIENDTEVKHNGTLIPYQGGKLNAGQVYYKTSSTDMTGDHIISDKPVAFFALSQGPQIPSGYCCVDILMQQLAPVSTWGKTFFVPVSHLAKDRVRIVVSQDGTNISQIGGELKSATGSQMTLTNLQAGQFVELEVTLNNNGCYIEADKPVGICTYLTGTMYNGFGISDPAQSWLPAIEQAVNKTLIAPFILVDNSLINTHHALVITPTTTRDNTKVSIGGAPPVDLTGGTWKAHSAAEMSFYSMPLTNHEASYYFTNTKGLLVMCYGIGEAESYYFLAGSAMRELQAAFYVNNIHFQELPDFFCTNDIEFRAETDGIGIVVDSLKWFINGKEEIAARDLETWSKTFAAGNYLIKLEVYYDDKVKIVESILNIGAQISATPMPGTGGSVEIIEEAECYKMGESVTLIATPATDYVFEHWKVNGVTVSTSSTITVTVTGDSAFVAHFRLNTYDITTSVNPPGTGTTTGSGTYSYMESITVTAEPKSLSSFTVKV